MHSTAKVRLKPPMNAPKRGNQKRGLDDVPEKSSKQLQDSVNREVHRRK
jgi:hypothetical protein